MELDYIKIGSNYVNSVIVPSQTEYGFRWFSKPIPNSSTLTSSTRYQLPRPRQKDVILGAQFKADSSGAMTHKIYTSSTYLGLAPGANGGAYADYQQNIRNWFSSNGTTSTYYKGIGYALHVSKIAYTLYYIKLKNANTYFSIFDEGNGNQIELYIKPHPDKDVCAGIKVLPNNYSFLNTKLSTTKYRSGSISYTYVGSNGDSVRGYKDLYSGSSETEFFHKNDDKWMDITNFMIDSDLYVTNSIIQSCVNAYNLVLISRNTSSNLKYVYTFLKKDSSTSYSKMILTGSRNTTSEDFKWTVSTSSTTAASAFNYRQDVSSDVFLADPVSNENPSVLYRADENSIFAYYTSPVNLRIVLNYPNYSGGTSVTVFDMPSKIEDDKAYFGFYPNGTDATTLIDRSNPVKVSQWGLDIIT